MDILEYINNTLDEDQQKAVFAPFNKPVCVRANAGSGKTRVLTTRFAYLVSKGVRGILLLTFTNKASREMTDRIDNLTKTLGLSKDYKVIAGTYHHLACKVLRKHSRALEIPSNFLIVDSQDCKSIMQKIRKEVLGSIPKNEVPKDFFSTSELISLYSFYRNKIKDIEFDNYLKDVKKILPFKRQLILQIINGYENYKKESNSLDFDDLLVKFRELLIKYPLTAKVIKKNYPAILVDEYQDSNYLQNDIVNIIDNSLADSPYRQYVVGDEDQCIYSWRGSNVSYILNFKDFHKDALVIYLRFNYRSGEGIVKVAQEAINQYKKEEDKKIMIAYQKSNIKPHIRKCVDDSTQAEDIVKAIKSNKFKYKDTAVLVRANYLTRNIEMAFRFNNIPYKLVGGIPFYQKGHIKDILSFISFLYNKKDKMSFMRMLSLIDGVGPKTAEKIYEAFKQLGFNFNEIENIKMPKKSRESILRLLEVLKNIENYKYINQKLMYIIDNFYSKYLEECKLTVAEFRNKSNDIYTFIEFSKIYTTVENLLEDLVLENEKEEDKDSNKVTISTVHRAKGLEWDNVFLPYMNEDIFPTRQSAFDNEILEEELRLFYVGITRAKKNLFISYTSIDCTGRNKSKFLNILNKNLVIFSKDEVFN